MTEGDTELQNTSDATVEGVQETVASDDYGDFPPGTIVLAKLKSFPPWPAIVIPYELIPENVSKSKPKPGSQHSSTSRSKRRSIAPQNKNDQAADNKLWCVRFLRDDTYMWGFRKDISLLTKDEIQKYLNGKKGKKLIRSAYEMAMNPPDVEEFIIYGSNGKPIEIDNEANDADFEIDADEDDDEGEDEGDNGDEGSLVDDDDDDDLEIDDIKPKTKKRTKASTKSSKRTKTTQQKKKGKTTNSRVTPKHQAPPEPETSSDEEWDQDYEGDEPVITDFPDSKKLISEVNRLRPILQRARIRFQNFFLDLNNLEIEQDISENTSLFKDSNKSLEQLEKSEDIPKSMVKHYHIHKILIDFLKRSDLNLKNSQIKKIRQRVNRLLTDWFDLEVEIDPNWDLSKEDNDQTEEAKIEEAGAGAEAEAEAEANDDKGGSIKVEEIEKKVTAQTPDGNGTNSFTDQKNGTVDELNNGD